MSLFGQLKANLIQVAAGGLLALAVLFCFLWLRADGAREVAVSERDAAIRVNTINQATIESQREQIRVNGEISLAQAGRDIVIHVDGQQEAAAVQRAAQENEDVAAYLATPIPDDLRRVLNTETGDAGRNLGAGSTGKPD